MVVSGRQDSQGRLISNVDVTHHNLGKPAVIVIPRRIIKTTFSAERPVMIKYLYFLQRRVRPTVTFMISEIR